MDTFYVRVIGAIFSGNSTQNGKEWSELEKIVLVFSMKKDHTDTNIKFLVN